METRAVSIILVAITALAVMATASNITLPFKLNAEGIYVLDLRWHFSEGKLIVAASLTLGGEMPMYGLSASVVRLNNATLEFNLTAYAPVWHAAELHWPLAILWNNVGEYTTITELWYAEEYGLTHLHVAGIVDLAEAAEVARKGGAPDDAVNALTELASGRCRAEGRGTVSLVINSTGASATVNGSGAWSSSGDVECVKALYTRMFPMLISLFKNATSGVLPAFVADLLDSAAPVAAALPGNASFSLVATAEDVPGGIRVVTHKFELKAGSEGSARPAEGHAWPHAISVAVLAAGVVAAATLAYLWWRRRA